MPGKNLELARQMYAVMNRGEIDHFLELVHPDYEFHPGVRVPSIPPVVRGRDGLRAWISQWYEEPWEELLQMDVEHRGARRRPGSGTAHAPRHRA